MSHQSKVDDAMPMRNLVHPGQIVRHDCLEPLGLSVTEGAKVFRVTRQAPNNRIIDQESAREPEHCTD